MKLKNPSTVQIPLQNLQFQSYGNDFHSIPLHFTCLQQEIFFSLKPSNTTEEKFVYGFKYC